MFSFHRLSETTKVFFVQQRKNAISGVLVICKMKRRGNYMRKRAAEMVSIVVHGNLYLMNFALL